MGCRKRSSRIFWERSASTVRAWERGAREPSDMARRLLELAERQPEVFEEVLVPVE